MLAAAERGEFDILPADDLSRLARDQVESERAIRRLEFRGIRIIATTDGSRKTPPSSAHSASVSASNASTANPPAASKYGPEV